MWQVKFASFKGVQSQIIEALLFWSYIKTSKNIADIMTKQSAVICWTSLHVISDHAAYALGIIDDICVDPDVVEALALIWCKIRIRV